MLVNGTAIGEKPPLVMSLLRTKTTSAHKQLEQAKCLARLFEQDYSMPEYQDLLCRFYGFFSAIEPLIFDNLPKTHIATLGRKIKTDFLAKDISLFGVSEAELRSIPRCDKLPNLCSFARQMGALYVLEGSTLGGRIISKRLKDHFGDAILDKLNYYNCYGENVGTEWKGFQNFMASQFDDEDAEIPDVVKAANDTFLSLHQWFDKP
jgi:heme oxygenase (biliverdin-IX-beta and delta-forming)